MNCKFNLLRFYILAIICFLIFLYIQPFLTRRFSGYLHTHDYGKKYKELYDWLFSDLEDYRIFWLPAPYPTQFEGMNFSGYDSFAFYLPKPVIYTCKYTGPKFLIFLLKNIYDCRTKYIDELLGISNTKYLIFDYKKRTTATDISWVDLYFPEERYTNDKILNTLKQQKNIKLLKNIDSIHVFENRSFLPHIFGLSKIGLVCGGLDSLISLCYTEKYKPKNMGIIFSSQISLDNLSVLRKIHNLSVIIQDNNYLEFVLDNIDRAYFLNPIAYYTSLTPDKGWAPFFWFWYNWYYQTSLEHFVFTWTEAVLKIPFYIKSEDKYKIFVKTYFGPRSSKIKVSIDNKEIKEIITKTSNERGFKWIKVDELSISKGKHLLSFKSDKGENILVKIIIVPNRIFEKASVEAFKFIQDKQVVLLSEFEKMELDDRLEVYDLGIEASQKFVVGVDSLYPIKYLLFVPKEGNYELYLRIFSKEYDILDMELYGKKFNIEIDRPNNFKWYRVCSVNLKSGENHFLFKPKKGTLYLDQLLLVEEGNEENLSPPFITYQKINPVRYKISAISQHPFYIFFSEKYHPSWKVILQNGRKINSFVGYSFGNLFFIDEMGKTDLLLEFERQRYVNIGKKVSLMSLIILIILLITPIKFEIFRIKNTRNDIKI